MLKRSITAWLLVAVMLFSAVLAAARPGAATAAPEPRIIPQAVVHQTLPDWMPPQTAAQLDVGIDVLVPLSIVWKLIGKDPLTRSRRSWPGWSPYPARYRDRQHYNRMY